MHHWLLQSTQEPALIRLWHSVAVSLHVVILCDFTICWQSSCYVGPGRRNLAQTRHNASNMHVVMLQGLKITILLQASPGVSENMAKVAVQRQALQQLLHHCTAQLLASQTCPVLVSQVIYLETKETCRQCFHSMHPLWWQNECVSASCATLFEPLYAVVSNALLLSARQEDVCKLLHQALPA